MHSKFYACLYLLTLCLSGLIDLASGGEVRGITDTEIVIGSWGPQTGPAALWGAVGRGTDLLFKIVNEEGGIHGRKIKYVFRDDAYQPAKTKAVAKELVENIGVFAVVGGVGTAPGMAVRDYLMENGVVWVSPATGSSNWTNPLQKFLFALYPRYVDEAYLLTRYASETLKAQKIAFFYQNDDYGKEGLVGAEKYLKEKGITLATTVPVEVMDIDLSSHALKFKESGAEAIILWVLPKHAAIILGETAKLGYKPQWIASSALGDSSLMFDITKGLWEEVTFANWAELPDSDHPLMAKYREAQKKYAFQERWGPFYYAGIAFAEPLVEGLKRAGRDLTSENLAKALESLRDWNDNIAGSISYTADDHQGSKSVFLAKCGPRGKPIRISEWLKVTE
jgi:ABC-type branched-subunit amino acid transport system substrate-binding protein